MSQPLLSVNGLMMRFGGLLAVNNVNLELYPQEIVSLIGPNGAGKTTVFNCLTGFYKPTGGTILLRDQHLEGLPGQQIARMGVVRTFQHVRLFREMTARYAATHAPPAGELCLMIKTLPTGRRRKSCAKR